MKQFFKSLLLSVFAVTLFSTASYAQSDTYFDELLQAAKAGDPEAQNQLGSCYLYGNEVEKDYELAVIWFRQSAEQDNEFGQYNLGLCYEHGYGLTQDYQQAAFWYKKAANQGNAEAQLNLGRLYFKGTEQPDQYNVAITYFEKAAEQDNHEALFELGNCYFLGLGVEKDYKRAAEYFAKISGVNLVPTTKNEIYTLVKTPLKRNIVSVVRGSEQANSEKAEVLSQEDIYQKAIQGDASAQYNLGKIKLNNGETEDALFWLKMAAEQDYFIACYDLAHIFAYGEDTDKDYSQASYWFNKAFLTNYSIGDMIYSVACDKYPDDSYYVLLQEAVDKGSKDALLELACLFAIGKGVKKDDNKALELYQQYYDNYGDHTDPNYKVTIYDVYYEIYCSESYMLYQSYDGDEVQWLKRAAEHGHTESQCEIGNIYDPEGEIYIYNENIKKDYNQAMKWWSFAAEKGDPEAQFNIATYYEKGLSVKKDYKQAFDFYKKSADNSYAKAIFKLAECYAQGKGTKKDMTLANDYYYKAASIYKKEAISELFLDDVSFYYQDALNGDATSQYKMGEYYFNPQGYDHVYWYQKAAEQNNDDAQYSLGYCYENGLGIAQDYVKAVYWYKKAAEQNNDDAQCSLGYCYENGLGLTQDYEQAVFWYKKAVEQGNDYAQFRLGNCYKDGRGVPQNNDQATYWYLKAIEQDNEEAKYQLGLCYYDSNDMEKNKLAAELFAEICNIYLTTQKTTEIKYECLEEQPTKNDLIIELGGLTAKELSEKAIAGDAKSQYILGMKYLYQGNTKDGTSWIKMAANSGLADAQFEMGNCYIKGILIDKNENDISSTQDQIFRVLIPKKVVVGEKFKVEFVLNAEGSNPLFPNLDGAKLIYGPSVSTSMTTTVIDGKQATNYKQTFSMYYIATTPGKLTLTPASITANGKRLSTSPATITILPNNSKLSNNDSFMDLDTESQENIANIAIDWYRKAAEQGHAGAQCKMGNYYNDKGDYAQAAQWFTKAAAQDEPEAQYRLATLYSNGNGVKKDKKLANEYYYKSATGFKASAEETLNKLGLDW